LLWAVPFLLGLDLPSSAFGAQDLQVAAQVDKTLVKTGEPLLFSVTISGPITENPKITLTSLEGFQVVSTGQSHQIQAGRKGARLTLTLFYTLAPPAPGTHSLGPVRVEYKGRTFQTQPIEVKVLPAPPRPEPDAKEEMQPEAGPEAEEWGPKEEPRLEGGIIL